MVIEGKELSLQTSQRRFLTVSSRKWLTDRQEKCEDHLKRMDM